jgi:16S rRNA (cytosine1402-N4)-methyltransferase
MKHITVLQREAVDALLLQPSDIVVDATFGAGGHAREILSLLDERGTYIGIDADETAFQTISFPDERPQIHLITNNFRNISEIVSSLHIENVNAILADLGWRMEQFSEGGKGFSFMHDEPLHMTFGNPAHYDYTAYDVVNEWEESSLADIIYGYGEETMARKIARAIVEARKEAPIKTTSKLSAIIESVFSARHYRKIHPATKTFQALRITVNDELGALETFLKAGFQVLAPQGRMAIITFHSLEDRVVKHYFKTLKESGLATLTTKKPIVPSREECSQNPRARSAKLRVITKQ